MFENYNIFILEEIRDEKRYEQMKQMLNTHQIKLVDLISRKTNHIVVGRFILLSYLQLYLKVIFTGIRCV